MCARTVGKALYLIETESDCKRARIVRTHTQKYDYNTRIDMRSAVL